MAKIDKPMWETHSDIWKTQAAFMSYVRGGIRLGLWNKNPVKLQFIKDNRVRAPLGKKTEKNPEGMVWGCECYLCNKLFRQTQCQVDHLEGNHSLKSMDDLRNFIEAMVSVTNDDLALVCKPCHDCKSYADRMEITFEEAKAHKKAIEVQKNNEDKEWLTAKKIKPESNAKKRRKQIVQYLLQES